MKLATGTRLGPYEIDHAIGAGGMGVVYRADDSRLGRKVAIKILPFAKGEHLRRFEREARTIGALNHPNLLTLYDVGEHEGTPFLVTELLEGESLRERLARGRIPLRTAIKIAGEVTRGLAAAHDAGVVHRDVKPDNIFLTTESRTKILDFGIAKLRRATSEMPAVDIGNEPTITPTTQDTGMVIGTPGYMAPEQLDGGKLDERTDIFALGVVLYEMICGRRAFASDSAVEESYAILKTTPDPPKGATKAIARVVMRCLEKRPEARFQSATDLAFALDELDASTDPIARISRVGLESESVPAQTIRDPEPPRHLPGPSRAWIAVTGAVGIVGVLAGVLLGKVVTKRPGLTPSWPTVVEGGPTYERVTYHSQSQWDARLSTDGKSALYTTLREGKEQVVRSQLANPSILPIGIAGRLVDISAKGELAVLSDELPGTGGTLSRVVEGAGPRPLTDRVTAAAWLHDGERLAVIRANQTLELPIGTVIAKRTTERLDLLRVAPSGELVGVVEHPGSADTGGHVLILDAAGKQLAVSSEQTGIEGAAWSPDGTELWWSNGPTIFALDRQGHQRTVVNSVTRLVLVDVRAQKILVAPSDLRLKMFTGPRGGPFKDVAWFDSSEVESVSADGQSLGFSEESDTGHTVDGYPQFIRRADQPATLIAHGMRSALMPDGSAALVIGGSPPRLSRVPTGIGTAVTFAPGQLTTLDAGDRIAVAWSGKFGVVRGADASGAMKLWRFDPGDPAAPPQPLPVAPPEGLHPISPDGQLLAVVRVRGGIELVRSDGTVVRSIEGVVRERPIGFTSDGTAVFVSHQKDDAIEIERITVATGERTGWARIVPEQHPYYYSVALSADGEILTYSTNSDASDLYVLAPPSVP